MNRIKNLTKKKECYFCVNGLKEVDYKDVQTLRRFISPYAKIIRRKRSGNCSKHQRKLAAAMCHRGNDRLRDTGAAKLPTRAVTGAK